MTTSEMYNLLEKRRAVRRYKTSDIPPRSLVEHLLWLAWKTTPSKNQMMPYAVKVLGPEKSEEKFKIWTKMTQQADNVESTYMKMKQIETRKDHPNYEYSPEYKHVRDNPYLLVFTQRVCELNEFYKEEVKYGHYAEQTIRSELHTIIDQSSVEIGYYAANLAMYCMEHDVDVSYGFCFPRDIEAWSDCKNYIEHTPLLLMTLGYGEIYRWQEMKADRKLHLDIKPEIDKVVEWID